MVILKREALEEMTEPQIESKAKKAKEVAHPEVKIPSYVGQSVTSILVFIMAATMRGKWVPFSVRPKPKLRLKLRSFSAESVRPKLRPRLPNCRITKVGLTEQFFVP